MSHQEENPEIEKLEAKRQERLKLADDEYYDRKSPHYRDNARFSWAVKTINDRINEEINELKKQP